jgi:peptidyl-prolyl cis-trans isomerase SurA
MNVLSFRPLRICLLGALLALVPAVASAQAVAVMVNGEPITHFDIDQRMKLNALSGNKSQTRQAVMDELIDEKVKIKEARKYGVDPTASDIDSSFAAMSQRMRMGPDQLTKMLESKGVRPETLRSRIKADMVWSSLVRGRFKDSLLVGEKEVRAAAGDADAKEGEAFEYQLRPIVLIVPQGSAPATVENRKREAEALRERVQTCADAEAMFRSMQNATIRGTVTKTSADLPVPLRELLDKTPVGRLTAPEVTRQGVEMVALCARNATTVDTPKRREARDKLYVEKYEAKQKAYLREIRKQAMIEMR